jgi:hypothetical protein
MGLSSLTVLHVGDHRVVGAVEFCAGAVGVSVADLLSSLGAMALSMHPVTERNSVAKSSRAANKEVVFLILIISFPSMNVCHFRNHLNNQSESVNFLSCEGMCIHEFYFML